MVRYGYLHSLDDRTIDLSLDDALFAARLDREHFHKPPMADFDPVDHERLAVQDALYEEAGDLPHFFGRWYVALEQGVTQPRFRGSDADFNHYAEAMCDALKLPLAMHVHLLDAWEAWGLPEAARRIAATERRLRAALHYGNGDRWQDADLLAEVEARCGQGRKEGAQWAFPCPWHTDRHPSLKVHPVKKTWYCWPCQKGGGVTAWRRAQ